MMPADMQSQAAKQYRDLIDGSLADSPLPEPSKPSYVDSPAEDRPQSGADSSSSTTFVLFIINVLFSRLGSA